MLRFYKSQSPSNPTVPWQPVLVDQHNCSSTGISQGVNESITEWNDCLVLIILCELEHPSSLTPRINYLILLFHGINCCYWMLCTCHMLNKVIQILQFLEFVACGASRMSFRYQQWSVASNTSNERNMSLFADCFTQKIKTYEYTQQPNFQKTPQIILK